MKMHDQRRQIVIKTHMKFSWFLSNASLAYVVHYKFWRHILDGDARGFHGAYKLMNIHQLVTFLKYFFMY